MSEINYGNIYNKLPCGVVVFDTERKLLFANDKYSKDFGNDVLAVTDGEDFDSKLSALGDDGTGVIDYKANSASGERILRMTVSKEPEGFLGVITDLTELCSDIEEIRSRHDVMLHSYETDPLSNVYNRAAAIEKINKYISKNPDRRDLALMVLDIDNFKTINDTYGHLYGDAVITMVANCLKNTCSKADIIGRFGGDEFFIFTPDSTLDEVETKARRINEVIVNLRNDITDESEISMSIGISVADAIDGEINFDVLFDGADKALFMAKYNGKNRYQFFEPMSMSLLGGHALDYAVHTEAEISTASSRDPISLTLEILAKSKDSDSAMRAVLRHIGLSYQMMQVQVMTIDCVEDLIHIEYEWYVDQNIAQKSKKSGYYRHSDIECFLKRFKAKGYFILSEENVSDFSEKMQNEFKKLSGHNVVYAAEFMGDILRMIVYTSPSSGRKWSLDELNALLEQTKMISVYANRNSNETEEQLRMRHAAEYHDDYGIYRLDKFIEQIGRIKYQAVNHGNLCIIGCICINNTEQLYRTYGFYTQLCHEVASLLKDKFMSTASIAGVVAGEDKFIVAMRYMPEYDIEGYLQETFSEFCENYNRRYQRAPISINIAYEKHIAPQEPHYAVRRVIFAATKMPEGEGCKCADVSE